MVFFTCDGCGESVKKKQVELHQSRCRRCQMLSCVDCGKNFWGNDYQEHTKCISEEEKYSGKDWKPKQGANKGEKKQNAWIEQVQSAIDKSRANPKLKHILEGLKDYPNIPRKEKKFMNFLQNSFNIRNQAQCHEVWKLISSEMHKPGTDSAIGQVAQTDPKQQTPPECDSAQTAPEQQTELKILNKRERKEERRKQKNKMEKKDTNLLVNGQEDEGEKMPQKKKKKKRKHGEEDIVGSQDCCDGDEIQNDRKGKKRKHLSENTIDGDPELSCKQTRLDSTVDEEKEACHGNQTFNWETVITDVLQAAPENQLSIKRLRKKVLAEYATRGIKKPEERLLAKFDKKVRKNPNFKVHKDKVTLKVLEQHTL